MALKPPNWAKDAIPTPRGWVKNGELLVSTRITTEEIEGYYGISSTPSMATFLVEPAPAAVSSVVEQLNEAPPSKSLTDMTKIELEALAEQYGIEIPRYATKTRLVEIISEQNAI
jgi:hypothetical protein